MSPAAARHWCNIERNTIDVANKQQLGQAVQLRSIDSRASGVVRLVKVSSCVAPGLWVSLDLRTSKMDHTANQNRKLVQVPLPLMDNDHLVAPDLRAELFHGSGSSCSLALGSIDVDAPDLCPTA
jgi:hypothetical protein